MQARREDLESESTLHLSSNNNMMKKVVLVVLALAVGVSARASAFAPIAPKSTLPTTLATDRSSSTFRQSLTIQ
jgi:hypothetical protein